MSDAATEVANRIAGKGPELLGQLRRMVGRMLDRHAIAAAVFLGPDGQPTPAAAKWFDQLARDNYVNGGGWHENDREHARREGRRELALEILRSAKLDVERLGALTRMEREVK